MTAKLEQAVEYCNKHKILPFFAHPDIRKVNGRVAVDDQFHIVIAEPNAAKWPEEWADTYGLQEFDYTVTLQDHMFRIVRKLKIGSCSEAGALWDALRHLALQRGGWNISN